MESIMKTMLENILAVLGGLAGLATLIGLVWRFLRPGESISKREPLIMRIFVIGGLAVLVLSMVLYERIH
jgi:hypothetical protein